VPARSYVLANQHVNTNIYNTCSDEIFEVMFTQLSDFVGITRGTEIQLQFSVPASPFIKVKRKGKVVPVLN
jgi:hypothetical protein